MTALTPASRDKLIGCLRLWERPGTPAERDAAAAGAVRLLRAAGLSWEDVIAVHQPVMPRERVPIGWRSVTAACLHQQGSLRTWERGFLESLSSFPRASPKQLATLNGIAARVLAERAA